MLYKYDFRPFWKRHGALSLFIHNELPNINSDRAENSDSNELLSIFVIWPEVEKTARIRCPKTFAP